MKLSFVAALRNGGLEVKSLVAKMVNELNVYNCVFLKKLACLRARFELLSGLEIVRPAQIVTKKVQVFAILDQHIHYLKHRPPGRNLQPSYPTRRLVGGERVRT